MPAGKAWLFAGIGLFLLIGGKVVTRPTLKYFSPKEFGVWYPLMNADLLLKLDKFREIWGGPVIISSAKGAIGRHGGESDTSQHNLDKWGEVRAIDVFPRIPVAGGGFRYISSSADRRRAFQAAEAAGFTGIGLYTDTQPGNLLHVDNRDGSRVATWSRVNGKYLGIQAVLA